MPRPPLAQHVQHVPEVLDVPALVGADRNRVHVLVDGGGHHLLDGAIVAKVDHLRPRPLEETPHDVDRRIVAVEEARGGDEPEGERGLARSLGGVFGDPVVESRLGHVGQVQRRSSEHETVRNPPRRVNFWPSRSVCAVGKSAWCGQRRAGTPGGERARLKDTGSRWARPKGANTAGHCLHRRCAGADRWLAMEPVGVGGRAPGRSAGSPGRHERAADGSAPEPGGGRYRSKAAWGRWFPMFRAKQGHHDEDMGFLAN